MLMVVQSKIHDVPEPELAGLVLVLVSKPRWAFLGSSTYFLISLPKNLEPISNIYTYMYKKTGTRKSYTSGILSDWKLALSSADPTPTSSTKHGPKRQMVTKPAMAGLV